MLTSTQTTLLILILLNTIFWFVTYARMVHYVRTNGGKVTLFSFNLMFPVISEYRKLYSEEIAPGTDLFRMWPISISVHVLMIVWLMLTFIQSEPPVPY
ncbi:hypothetical protein KQI52_14485 [bacterium]|nr:hypothetical protein [bacterium]